MEGDEGGGRHRAEPVHRRQVRRHLRGVWIGMGWVPGGRGGGGE